MGCFMFLIVLCLLTALCVTWARYFLVIWCCICICFVFFVVGCLGHESSVISFDPYSHLPNSAIFLDKGCSDAFRSFPPQSSSAKTTSGWWFGTFFIFPYIGNNHPNWLIFFRGVQTTNQTNDLSADPINSDPTDRVFFEPNNARTAWAILIRTSRSPRPMIHRKSSVPTLMWNPWVTWIRWIPKGCDL